MAVIGLITIGMRVSTQGLKKGLKESQSALARFKSSISPAKLGLTALAAGAAATGAAFLAFRKTMSQFGDLDRLAKFSRQIGISASELKGLQHGAALSGVEVSTLERGMQRFVRVLGDAQKGEKTAVKGLKALGLNADELSRLDTASALKQVSQAISQLETPAQKASAAYAIFGRSGQDLIPLLEVGADKMQDFLDKAKKLGFSGMSIEEVEKANDAMADLGLAVEIFWKNMAIKLSPVITDVAAKLSNMFASLDLSKIQSFAGQLITGVAGGFQKMFGFIKSNWDTITSVFDTAMTGVKTLIGGIASLVKWFSDLIGKTGGAIAAVLLFAKLNPFAALISGVVLIIGKLEEMKKGLGTATLKWVAGVGVAVIATTKLIGAMTLLSVAIGKVKVAFAAMAATSFGSNLSWAVARVGLLTVALKAVGVALVGIGSYLITKKIAEAFNWQGVKDYNEQLERTKKLQTELLGRQAKQQQAVITQSIEIEDPNERKNFLADKLAMAEKNLSGMANTVRGAKAEVEKYNTTWKNLIGHKELERTRKELENATQSYDQQRQHVQDLRDALNATTGEIQKQAEARKKAAEASKQEALESFNFENLKKGTDLIEKMREEVETFGLTSRQVEIKKLEGLVDPSVIQELRSLDKQLSAMEKRKEILGEIAEATKRPVDEFRATVARYRQALEAGDISQKKFAQAARKAAESILGIQVDLTPLETYRQTIETLRVAFEQGGLSAKEYQAKLNQAFEQLKTDKFDQLPDRMKQAVEKSKTPLDKFREEIKKLEPFKVQLFELYGEDKAKEIWANTVDNLQKEIQDGIGEATDKSHEIQLAPTWKQDPLAMILAVREHFGKPIKIKPEVDDKDRLKAMAERAKVSFAAPKVEPIAAPKPPVVPPVPPVEPPDTSGITAQLENSFAEIEGNLLDNLDRLPPPEFAPFEMPPVIKPPVIEPLRIGAIEPPNTEALQNTLQQSFTIEPIDTTGLTQRIEENLRSIEPIVEPIQFQPQAPVISRAETIENEATRPEFAARKEIFDKLETINQEQLTQLQQQTAYLETLASKVEQPKEFNF